MGMCENLNYSALEWFVNLIFHFCYVSIVLDKEHSSINDKTLALHIVYFCLRSKSAIYNMISQ